MEEFLSDENQTEESTIDWKQEKKMWLSSINKLYSDVSTWLEPLKTNPNFKITMDTIVLNEEEVGDYEVQRMIFELKSQRAFLQPIGTMIIAAKGRIDLIGANGTVKLILVDKQLTKPKVTANIYTEKEFAKYLEKAQGKDPAKEPRKPEYEWKIMTQPPNVQYISLNEETFSDALLRVIRNG